MTKRKTTPHLPKGRPTDYNEELAAVICSRISGGESLKAICREDSMPCAQTVFVWLFKHPEFNDRYAKARDEQADVYADEIAEISDNGMNDWMDTNDPDNPGYRVNGEAIARSRLRIDTRKWIASKLKPKKYGEKIQQEVSGPDGGAIPHVVSIKFVKPENNE